MHTRDPQIHSLIYQVCTLAKNTFGERCTAAYLMGSLARGGFSEATSDIDMGVLLQSPLRDSDAQQMDSIATEARRAHPQVRNSLSIFWGSIDSVNGQDGGGRYPPFDRLDLIEHARLLCGDDCRSHLLRPSQRELEVSGVEFALEYLASPTCVAEFHDVQKLLARGVVSVTKTVLFPPRFIYLVETGAVAGNEVSQLHYLEHFSGSDAELVALAYRWRFEGLPSSSEEAVAALEAGLLPLYQRFLALYIERMRAHGEMGLADRLSRWQKGIASK